MEPVPAGLVSQLSVGDREALLLHIRRLTLGERIACTLSCPSCSKKMDLELRINELLFPAYPVGQRLYEADVSDEAHSYHVIFRLPNGEDQEVAAGSASQSTESAANLLLRRCVHSITAADGECIADLPAVVLRELPEKMAALDPQAELLFDLVCPECGTGFVVPFDVADYLCRELASNGRDFYREIHALCFHYHWTEEAALGLSRRKRRIYLDLLSDELAQGGRG
jgi:hypothetical protein